jgi:hypothetical protein
VLPPWKEVVEVDEHQTTERQFPIMDGKGRSSIPWRVIAPHEAQAQRNHGQSLKRLAERGGLCWSEAWGILTGVGWSRLPRNQEDRCKAAVLAIVQKESADAE